MSQSDADRRAAAAVVQHHTELADTLNAHVRRLRDAAVGCSAAQVMRDRQALLAWLHTELLPHARAEEGTLYAAAAGQPGGPPLVEGMLAEHQAITALIAELDAAGTTVDVAAAARALTALFAIHLAKENDLILPMLLAAEEIDVAELLEGMHDLLGGTESAGNAGGCGDGGECGCGGDTGAAGAEAPMLTLDTRLDVRDLPHAERHARVLAALHGLPADGALVLIAPHIPRPLLAEIDARYPGQIDTEWLQEGPDVWQIRLHRQPSTV